jgi:acyl carrier protein
MADAVLDQVLDAVRAVFAAKGTAPPSSLGGDTPLDGSLGLDSLDFVDVVAALETRFGFDPFATAVIDRLTTLGELADLYRTAR